MNRKTKTLSPLLTTAALLCLAAATAGAAEPAALPSPATGQTMSLLTAILKMAGSLAVVVTLMFLLLYFLKKTGLNQGGGRAGSLIRVMDTRMIAPKKYIAIVEIADQCLAVGITEHNINLLTVLGDEVKTSLGVAAGHTGPGSSSFAGVLRRSLRSLKAAPLGRHPESNNE